MSQVQSTDGIREKRLALISTAAAFLFLFGFGLLALFQGGTEPRVETPEDHRTQQTYETYLKKICLQNPKQPACIRLLRAELSNQRTTTNQ